MAICGGCGKYRADVYARVRKDIAGDATTENVCSDCANRSGKNGAHGSIIVMIMCAILFLFVHYASAVPSSSIDTTAPPVKQLSRDNTQPSLVNKAIDAKAAAEINLRASLKDGDSARFDDEFVSRLSSGNLMLCGEVNSKNAFGAYTGFKRFIASANPEAPNMIEGEEMMGMEIDDKTFAKAYDFACRHPLQRF